MTLPALLVASSETFTFGPWGQTFIDGSDRTHFAQSCRVEEYMRNPPPNEWDGVEHLKSKSCVAPVTGAGAKLSI